jgi:hypothetical protein
MVSVCGVVTHLDPSDLGQVSYLLYVDLCQARRGVMPLLIRKYKLASGLAQEERIDDPDRIDRYLRMFEKDDLKKLNTGVKVFIEKDEWQLLP